MNMRANVYMSIIGLLILIIHRAALLITFYNRFKLRYTIGILLIALVLTNQFRNMTGDIIQWNALTFSRGQETSKPMDPFNFGTVIEATIAVFEPLIKKQGNTLVRDIEKNNTNQR